MIHGVRHDGFHLIVCDSGVTVFANAGGTRATGMHLLNRSISKCERDDRFGFSGDGFRLTSCSILTL